ncbi:MAG: hypothetical protein JW963_25250 [Anaerolineales bacterium]|nr:hypothetical protein [Anaerolineales bacterium]
MKPFVSTFLVLILSLFLAACSAATPAVPAVGATQLPPAVAAGDATPTPYAAEYLSTEYADAASLRNQLAYGTLLLEGTEQAVTPEQARNLLPLWQAIVALSGDETTAAEELTAVQNQITEALTPAQLEAIAAMRITNTDLNTFYADLGVVFPTPVPGVTKVPGKNSGISQEDREATKTAAEALGTPVGTGSSTGQAAKSMLFDTVIEMLAGRASQ